MVWAVLANAEKEQPEHKCLWEGTGVNYAREIYHNESGWYGSG